MAISMIAAIGKNRELGKNNDLIWHFKEDMKFFRETTTGNTVVMGRKTFESLPHALPNRRNIVITQNKNYVADGAETAGSIDEALEMAKNDNVFIIGGGKIYSEFLEFADKLYLTEIDDECEDADTFFPYFNKEDYNAERLTDFTVDGIHFSHILYTKK
ncbi:MAG: dihydrofolate reductase [Oscillospiraceae bacterium]|nr:dihydrofolate reductase [Oscillospiraceae bacterium]